MKIQHLALALAGGLLGAGLLQAQDLPGSGARVVALKGSLTLKRLRQETQLLRVNDLVQPGDELATGENSEAVLRTGSGATVRLYPDSRVIFSEQSADVQEFLHLFLGSIKVWIQKLTGRPNPHQITTPTAVIAVRGTTFSVFVDEEDSTLVAVDEGLVAVANVRWPGDEVMVHGGQRTWIRAGQRPMEAQRFRGRSERADLAPGPGASARGARSMPPAMMPGSRSLHGVGPMSGRMPH